jgi:hypothetical protein
MSNSWQIVAVKVFDKPANYLKLKTTESTLGTTALGTALGGALRARRFITKFVSTLLAVASGVYNGNIWTAVVSGDGVFPTGNIACVQANASGDTVTFTFGTLAIVFTEAGSGVQGFLRGATNTATAAALAAAINAHPVLGGVIKATPSSGNCALVGLIPTALLQGIVITTSDATAFTLTQLTGGVPGTASLFPQSIATSKISV